MNVSKEDMYMLVGQKLNNSVSPLFRNESINNIVEKQEKFAKKVVENLYENIVYKEDFEINPEESMANMFAESILNYKTVENIAKVYNNRLPAGMNLDNLKSYAKAEADQLTEMWAQEAKYQMIEIENFTEGCAERGIAPSQSYLCENFGLFNEFNNLLNTEKGNDGDFGKAVISEMDNDDKMKLAIRIDTFKNALTSIGVNANDKEISNKIHEAFEKNLFV